MTVLDVVVLRYALPKGEAPAKPTVDGKEVEPTKVFETARQGDAPQFFSHCGKRRGGDMIQ